MNPLQLAALNGLLASLKTIRGISAEYTIHANGSFPTVSNYVVNPLSVCFSLQDDQTHENLPDFPVIEIRKTGKFALPTIRSYRESAGQNTLLPYPQGNTAFDAALFADSHVRKQNGAWLRRSPQAATAAMTAAIAVPSTGNPATLASLPVPVLAPTGISPETGQDTGKMLEQMHGTGKEKGKK